jgi:Mg2+ and Co2+ transporter CorA
MLMEVKMTQDDKKAVTWTIGILGGIALIAVVAIMTGLVPMAPAN